MLRVFQRKSQCMLVVFATLLMISTEAAAEDRDVCMERDGTRSIDACTRVIDKGQLGGKDLATIYVLRASTYRSNQQYDRAIEDMSRAIELLIGSTTNDVVASAYVTRGSIYSLKGDANKALDDYKQATELDATNSQATAAIASLKMEKDAATPQSNAFNEPDDFFNGRPFPITTHSEGTFELTFGKDGIETYRQTNCGSSCSFTEYRYLRTISGFCEIGPLPRNDPKKDRYCYILRKMNDGQWGISAVGSQFVAVVWTKP